MQILQHKASGPCWFVAAQLPLSRLTRFPVSGVNGLTLAVGRGVSAGILICPSKHTEPIDSSQPWKLTRRLRLQRNVLRKSKGEAMKESTMMRKIMRDPIRSIPFSPVTPCGAIYINRLGLDEQRGRSHFLSPTSEWHVLSWTEFRSLIICPHDRPSRAAVSEHASHSPNERIGEFPECIVKNHLGFSASFANIVQNLLHA